MHSGCGRRTSRSGSGPSKTNAKKNKKKKKKKKKPGGKGVVEMVKTKKPRECDTLYDSDYWTTGMLGDYIKRTYQVEYKSKTSLYLLFREAKFTYHKPGRVYERRDQEAVDAWKKEVFPILKKACTEPN